MKKARWILQILCLSLALAACNKGGSDDPASPGTAPISPLNPSPSQPDSPIISTPPVGITPVTEAPVISGTEPQVSPAPISSGNPVLATPEPTIPALVPPTVVLVTPEEAAPANAIIEVLPVITTSEPQTPSAPLLSDLLSEAPAVDEDQPASALAIAPVPSTSPVLAETSPAEETIPESAPDSMIPILVAITPTTTTNTDPVSSIELPAVEIPETVPTATTTTTSTTTTSTTMPSAPSTTTTTLPDPEAGSPAPSDEDQDQMIEVKGNCSGKKTVIITVSHTHKNNQSQKIVTKCVKDSFMIRLTIKKKDLPFIQVLTELN